MDHFAGKSADCAGHGEPGVAASFGEGIVATPSTLENRPNCRRTLNCSIGSPVNSLLKAGRMKPRHRLMLLSKAINGERRHPREDAKLDGDNRFLWRMPRQRLEGDHSRQILKCRGR